jgi:hypothetical protein
MRQPRKPSRSCGSTIGPHDVANAKEQSAPQLNNWGYEVNAKPLLDSPQKTELCPLRSFAELMIELHAGDFNDSAGAVPARTANRKPDIAARNKPSETPARSGGSPAVEHAGRHAITRKLK